MFSSDSSFELYDSTILNFTIAEDCVTLWCLYMNFDRAKVIFKDLEQPLICRDLCGRHISFIKNLDRGYEVHYMDESIEPTVIMAKTFRIEWE